MGYAVQKIGRKVDYTITWGGFSVNPTVQSSFYVLDGDICHVWWTISAFGTLSGTTMTGTGPFNAADTCFDVVTVTNNGTTTAGRITTAAGSNVFTFGVSANASGGFSASANSCARLCGFSYRIQQ